MYWIPKMHKNPTSACFIIASKICSTKQSSDRIITSFQFFKSFKLLSNINKKIVKKSISTYAFSKLRHNKSKCKVPSIVDFTFR